MLERGLHGLEPVVIATFPTKKYSDGVFSSGEDSQCTVCLSEYQEKDTLRILPYCGHAFHVSCIDTWLQQHSTCPVCRISLRDSSEGKRLMPPMFSTAFRSAYGLHTVAAHSYHCLYSGHVYSNETGNERRMGSIEEEHFGSEFEAPDSGHSVSVLIDHASYMSTNHHHISESSAKPGPELIQSDNMGVEKGKEGKVGGDGFNRKCDGIQSTEGCHLQGCSTLD
ncbi:E3 ubiquitin-protein ligase RNF128 isoform X2 [Amborella trichopoda]|uniref:E3 ubiquitin-protein ligase RNF128 isoform X2 n=1 Tax=Amborella trichopoda TaxID=13333 RepID=UPI0005D30F59|nr:E3 ubiquitin-protein ligase RNF128 isoform X2 [Amborella trichopoda]|eukprot:XP_011625978.1 E3 ubiquitin-protein ligase RNF128 isoform X2 [Amborella trichopoda]